MSRSAANSAASDHTPVASVLLRLFWMGAGLLGLVAAAAALASRAGEAPMLLSVIYWALVASIAAARYLDVARYQGQTVDLKPANLGHWRRHTLGLVGLAVPVWIVALLAGQ